jgi:hypothetical protein
MTGASRDGSFKARRRVMAHRQSVVHQVQWASVESPLQWPGRPAEGMLMTESSFQPDDMFSGLDSDSAQLIADRTIEVWEALARAIVPLIGDKGFSILFARCVHLTRATYPWLALDRVEPAPERFAGLRKILEGRSGTDALAASRALLVTFNDALAVLIGAPLTAGMLGAIRGSGPSLTQEILS